MGTRGPAPTPSKILEARGSWRAGVNPREPRPERGAPVCPNHLGKEAKEVWRKIVKMLDTMGVLTKVDGGQIERYCVYFVRWRQCEEHIAKHGISYPLKSDDPTCFVGRLPDGEAVVGFVEYPQVRESHRLDKALKQIEAGFGLTPSARTRIASGDDAQIFTEGPRLADFVG